MAEEVKLKIAEKSNNLSVIQNGPVGALPPALETIGSFEATGKESESNPGPSNSAALLQEEIETLRRQVEGWKELYQSTRVLIKDKDAEIAQLLLSATGTPKAITNGAQNDPAPAAPAVKPTTVLKKGTKPKPLGKKPKKQQQPNDVRIQHLMKRLRNRANIPKDEFTELHDFAMVIDDIWLAAQDENFVVQPSYDKKLMPELIKLLPRVAREKFNKLSNDLPKKSLEEFSVWINDVVDEAIGITGSSDEWEDCSDGELFY